MDGVLDLIFTFIFCLLTKVDDWVGFSSQSWLGLLFLGRLEESCPVVFVHWVVPFAILSIYFFMKKKVNFYNFVKLESKTYLFENWSC